MSNKSSSSGLGFGTVVFLIFLVLKLAEIGAVAKWSWWWVTSPLWIPLVLVVIFFPLYVFIKLIGKK
jgi:hypothetical protein